MFGYIVTYPDALPEARQQRFKAMYCGLCRVLRKRHGMIGSTTLSNDLTEALRTRFRRMTRLEQVEQDGDMEITGEITGYNVAPAAVTANEVAARNRLTVTVTVNFVNRKYPEDDFSDKTFSAYSEYDSSNSLDAVESSLCTEIIDQIIEDIFNATVAQW